MGGTARGGGEAGGVASERGRDCSDSAPSGLRAGPMGWPLTCGPQVLWTAVHPLPPSSQTHSYLPQPLSPPDAKINSQLAGGPQGLCTHCSLCLKYPPHHKAESSNARSPHKYCFLIKTPLSASSFSVSPRLLVQNSKDNYLLLCLSSEFLSNSPSLKVGSPSKEARPLLERW